MHVELLSNHLYGPSTAKSIDGSRKPNESLSLRLVKILHFSSKIRTVEMSLSLLINSFRIIIVFWNLKGRPSVLCFLGKKMHDKLDTRPTNLELQSLKPAII